jgi:pimeloyl-ACP methyl ester carboxylesterase
MRILTAAIVILSLTGAFQNAGAQDSPDPQPQEEAAVPWNLSIKTAGGTQVWTDHLYREGFRIQQNSLTGHWRLLDPSDVRQAWGTRQQCQLGLDQLKPQTTPTDGQPKHTVILLHGLMRTQHSMKNLGTKISETEPVDVIRFSYASTRASIGDHAVALRAVMENLPADTQFSFVGHSMGNIVVRHLVGDLQQNDPHGILPRCKSMVMLGPPNQGAAIARRLAPTGLYGIVTGKGGMELGANWNEFVKKLATPPFPFMIIAGDRSEATIQNPLVAGSSDFVVSVEEAKLDGCEKFETVPVLHSFLMDDPTAMKLAVDFIHNHQ